MRDDQPPGTARDPTGDATTPGTDPAFDDWPISEGEHAGASYVGTTTGGVPVYHGDGTVFQGRVDEDNREIVPDRDTERELEPGETLGELLEEMGDTLGWESLSEYGERHRSDEK
ncbi:hypothetical protein [Natrononativus amylolyticus]|uniref:hypothetical protein n=1 Tax=Natrononativus amylolyticus TaxID=2963434 RepID=UPI0020CCBB31|nr:hypothetical protein [Natrononativus amylolyticus]